MSTVDTNRICFKRYNFKCLVLFLFAQIFIFSNETFANFLFFFVVILLFIVLVVIRRDSIAEVNRLRQMCTKIKNIFKHLYIRVSVIPLFIVFHLHHMVDLVFWLVYITNFEKFEKCQKASENLVSYRGPKKLYSNHKLLVTAYSCCKKLIFNTDTLIHMSTYIYMYTLTCVYIGNGYRNSRPSLHSQPYCHWKVQSSCNSIN